MDWLNQLTGKSIYIKNYQMIKTILLNWMNSSNTDSIQFKSVLIENQNWIFQQWNSQKSELSKTHVCVRKIQNSNHFEDIKTLENNGVVIHDESIIAENFNDHFTDIGANLAQKLIEPVANKTLAKYTTLFIWQK